MLVNIETLARTVLSASRKKWLGSKLVFKPHAKVTPEELKSLEGKIGASVPNQLYHWLKLVGYGDVGEELSFRKEWFVTLETGPLNGGVRFAQDILGNFYAFDSFGTIYYLSRSEPVFAAISNDFLDFLSELVRRNYKLVDWIDTLETKRYEW